MIGQPSLHNNSNDNGSKVISYATSKGITINNTFFPQTQIHKQTWIYPERTVKNQINHVMTYSRRKHFITDVKSCSLWDLVPFLSRNQITSQIVGKVERKETK